MVAQNLTTVLFCFVVALSNASTPPSVHSEATFQVKQQLAVQYGQAVSCNAQPCGSHPSGACQNPEPDSGIKPTAHCVKPRLYNLTLDLYTPIGAEPLGPRPAFVAIHSGSYKSNNETGCRGEMTAVCKYFASRGFVAITMDYRLTNSQTGGGLVPTNWSVPFPVKNWSGFIPSPNSAYAAIRDTKAAIRWLRGQAGELNIDNTYFGAGGWSAGACTTVMLASQFEWDFTTEMSTMDDPSFHTLGPYLNQSSSIKAGCVWAGNGAVTETIDTLTRINRHNAMNSPIAMYRGSEDGVMSPWNQVQVQAAFNASGATCDLFAVPGVGHSTLFPTGLVETENGNPVTPRVPVLNHSYSWITKAMDLNVL